MKPNSYTILLRAYRLMKKRKNPILARDVSGNTNLTRPALKALVKLDIAERVPMIYKCGRKYRAEKTVQGYKLKKKEIK